MADGRMARLTVSPSPTPKPGDPPIANRSSSPESGPGDTAVTVSDVTTATREPTTTQKDQLTAIGDGRRPRQLAESPNTVRHRVERMITQSSAIQITVQDQLPDQQARLHSDALIAEALERSACPRRTKVEDHHGRDHRSATAEA